MFLLKHIFLTKKSEFAPYKVFFNVNFFSRKRTLLIGLKMIKKPRPNDITLLVKKKRRHYDITFTHK